MGNYLVSKKVLKEYKSGCGFPQPTSVLLTTGRSSRRRAWVISS